MSDCTSIRDAPPVAKTATTKNANNQNAGAGWLVEREISKLDLITLYGNEEYFLFKIGW